MHQDHLIEELIGDESKDFDVLDGSKNDSSIAKNGQTSATGKKKKKKKKTTAGEESKQAPESPDASKEGI
jgi:hypothetical protein